MPNISNTRERPLIEPEADGANKSTLSAVASLRLHWPEYLMDAGEAGCYLFSRCAVATLLWHSASPIQRCLPGDAVRRTIKGCERTTSTRRYPAASSVLSATRRKLQFTRN